MTDYLILSPHARVLGGSLRMTTSDGECRIEAPRSLLTEMAARADGTAPTAVWLDALARRWRHEDLEPFVDHLVDEGFLVRVENLPATLWQHVMNPRRLGEQPDDEHVARLVALASARTLAERGVPEREDTLLLSPTPTHLTHALGARRSVRRFATTTVAAEKIAALLWAGYGANADVESEEGADGSTRVTRTVPSAGALYPLDLYLCNLRRVDGLAAGVYRARFTVNRLVRLDKLPADVGALVRAFGDPSLIEHAQGVVIVAGEFALSARKYGVRALSYVALEAGHVAQNILLQAQALELAAVELGGFIEDVLSRVAGLPPKSMPLTTIAFGSAERGEPARRIPATGCTFEWLDFDTRTYRLPFSIGQARSASAGEWSWGRDRDPSRAWLKAIMEAHERRACESPGETIDARYDEWDDALAPAVLVRYGSHQHARTGFPFAAFDRRARYDWVRGTDVETGKPVGVAADHIYYVHALRAGRSKLTAATSSGVAAHETPGQALENAVLELIERDAFMRAWLERRPPVEIAPETLPADIQARLAALEDAGVKVWVRALDTPCGAGIFVAGQCARRHFTCVASDVAHDACAALDHALMELEAAVAASLSFSDVAPIEPSKVVTSQDHARLYAQRRYFRRADWLIAAAGTKVDFQAVARRAHQPGSICETLFAAGQRIVTVDMWQANETHAEAPHIVRALMPGCIPLSFGYGLEPEGMLPRAPRQRTRPSFPHPFT